MKKTLTLLSVTASALALSGCCFFMSPPPEEAKPAPEPAKAVVVAPVTVAPAPLPVDSDKDGVIDEDDKCPGTAAGVAVDATGCPLDSDKDGVIDSLDQCPDTKAGMAVDSKGCPPPIEENVKIAIGVLFATGKADIKEDSTDDIKKLGVFMQTYPTTTTVIEGHTDSVGSAALNKELSQRRADAVRDYLIKNYSIDANRIKAVGYGPDRPVADNATAAGRQQNRRIEAAIETVIVKPQE
ncbi:MAG: OmpA family protein [Desulfuromonadales bacterium]|nr:OmpA family protein [Desulfuromonadales bacterium]